MRTVLHAHVSDDGRPSVISTLILLALGLFFVGSGYFLCLLVHRPHDAWAQLAKEKRRADRAEQTQRKCHEAHKKSVQANDWLRGENRRLIDERAHEARNRAMGR